MAIVLPQGRFNNSSDKNIRDFIAERCRILAVVGLHGNTFKPHTGTKTSVLFVQKWNDAPKEGALCPRRDDYNIFFATMQKSGKDNSGEKMYRRIMHQDEEGLPDKEKDRQFLLDPHDHLIVDHDLYNHEGLTEDGIAEAFIEFAKKEQLSSFEPSPSVTPFDAVSYQQLMDGLEAVEVSLKQVLRDNLPLRIDSEYFGKYYLTNLKMVEKHSYRKINEFAYVTDGIHESIDFDEDSNILSFSAKYPKENYFDLTEIKKISKRQHNLNPRTQFQEDDVIISTVGTIGNCAVVDKSVLPANSDRDVGIIRIQDKSVKPRFLSTFLVGRYGRFQSERESTGNVQLHLFIYKIKEIKVPRLEMDFQENIEGIVKSSKVLLDSSKEFYQQAEDLLLSELGLQDWQSTEETFAVKSFAESFRACDRLDAEYYQPKQQKVMAIMHQSGLCIGDVAPLAKRKFQPDKQGEFNYIEIGNLSGEGFANGEVVAMDEAPSRAQWIVKPNDVITSTVRPIRRLSALIESEQNNYICSSGFAVLKPTKIEPEVLLVYLRSPIVCEILDLHTTASMYPAISTEDLLKIPITLPKESTRQKITEKVKDSRKARERSKQLLEIAKTGVEGAIETDEATAITWINQQLEALEVNIS
jgi:type I restriction enzyme M protein